MNCEDEMSRSVQVLIPILPRLILLTLRHRTQSERCFDVLSVSLHLFVFVVRLVIFLIAVVRSGVEGGWWGRCYRGGCGVAETLGLLKQNQLFTFLLSSLSNPLLKFQYDSKQITLQSFWCNHNPENLPTKVVHGYVFLLNLRFSLN